MGRIKSLMVKRAARQILEAKSELFTGVFSENKKALGGSTLPSKSTRNKIAGYLGRMVLIKKELAERALKAPQPVAKVQAE